MKQQFFKLAGMLLLAMPLSATANLNPASPQSTLIEVTIEKPLV